MYGLDRYAHILNRLAAERNINVNVFHKLIEIKPQNRKAIFRDNATNKLKTFDYDFLQVAPPMGPPNFINQSKLADATGFVDAHKYTLRHNKYPNVYAIGDCSNLPTTKTSAAITGQSGALKKNLIADMEGKKLKEPGEYDSYMSCTLVIGRNELVLAEFLKYALASTWKPFLLINDESAALPTLSTRKLCQPSIGTVS